METESGPAYPNLSLARHRRIAGLPAGQDPEAKRAYGRAVHEAIRALQRRELFGPARLGFRPQCASGTFLNADIGKAIRAQQAAKLARDAAADRKARSDETIVGLYHAHMKTQRAVTSANQR